MAQINKPLAIAGVEYSSRLLVGTGKYRDFNQTAQAIRASGAEIVTVAVKRTNIGQHARSDNLLDIIRPGDYTILPNTAGCYTAEDARRVCLLARDLLDGRSLVKLEVLADSHTLLPNVLETVRAVKMLVQDGFEIMVYCTDDPHLAKHLEQEGCVAIMPLAAPIGSGLGIQNRYNIELILESATLPVIVDAGVGTVSDAAITMELGCDAILVNSAIAMADDPLLMAKGMCYAVKAGRLAWCAGRMKKVYRGARPSSDKIGSIS